MLMCLPEGIVAVDASNLVFFLGLNFDFNNMSNVTYIYTIHCIHPLKKLSRDNWNIMGLTIIGV